jgi:hypothetical protein
MNETINALKIINKIDESEMLHDLLHNTQVFNKNIIGGIFLFLLFFIANLLIDNMHSFYITLLVFSFCLFFCILITKQNYLFVDE